MTTLTPGIRSSEWKGVLLAGTMIVATGFDLDWFHLDLELVKWFVGVVGVYAIKRGYVKGEHSKANKPTAPTGEQRVP